MQLVPQQEFELAVVSQTESSVQQKRFIMSRRMPFSALRILVQYTRWISDIYLLPYCKNTRCSSCHWYCVIVSASGPTTCSTFYVTNKT